MPDIKESVYSATWMRRDIRSEQGSSLTNVFLLTKDSEGH